MDSDQDSVNVLEQSGSSGTSGSPGTNKNDSAGDEIGNAVPLVDTVLCFVMNGLNTETAENVLKVASSTFTINEVRQSVCKLWEYCKLGDVPVRNNTQRRTECSALLNDLIQKLQSLDETGKIPYLCCDVIGLSRIPRFQVEDISDIAMAERIRRLEIKLLMLDQKVCDNSEHLLNIPPRSSGPAADNGSTVVLKVLSNITVSELAEKLNLTIHTPKIAPQGDSENCNSSNKQQSATSLISKEDPNDNNVNHNSNDNQQKQPSVTGLPSKDAPHGDNSDDKKQKQPPVLMPSPITSPNKHAKRDAAQPTYSRTLSQGLKSTESGFCMFSGVDSSRVYGTASSSSRLKVAQDLFKHLFVTGFDKDSTPEEVMQHLQYNKIRFRFAKKIPCKDDDKRASFKLTVPISAYEHVFSSNAWPVGIYVREFFQRTKAK